MKKLFLAAFLLTLSICSTLSAQETTIIPMPCGYTKLVFNDEFNNDGFPDESKWGYEKGYIRNGEKQYYTVKRQENCYIKDGLLHIVALNDSAKVDGDVRPVTSTSLLTKNKHSWTYCRVEVRAKLPMCLGSWPAIWMMPNNSKYGSWPKSGEIDIMEHVGYEPNNVHYAIHSEKYNHVLNTQKRHTVTCNTSYSDFHVYALEWHADRIDWILDGEVMYTVVNDEDVWDAWPFNQPFYLILNFAFGGGWGGYAGIDLKGLPQTYLIDYVRIFQ